MRWPLLSLLLILPVPAALGAEGSLAWHRGLAPLEDGSPAKLIVSVITNDDPVRLQSDSARPWCDRSLQRRFEVLFQRRPELAEKLVFQFVPAGLPAILTGGEPRNRPKRVVMAVCDERLRLLGMCVGIPEVHALHDLIEDAEEVRRLRSAGREALQQQIADRVSEHLPRHWNAAMQKCLRIATAIPLADPPVGPEPAPQETPPAEQAPPLQQMPPLEQAPPLEQVVSEELGPRQIARRVAADLHPVYQRDARLRFGFDPDQAWRRLAVLEQHAETRRPWCQAVLPALADLQWQRFWRPLVGAIWPHAPLRPQPADEQLLSWFRWHEEAAVVVEIRQSPWAPVASRPPGAPAARRGAPAVLDQQLADRLDEMPYRTVSLEQLAVLLQEHGDSPIDLERPAPARYVIFVPDEPDPLVVRAGDSPARWSRRIEQLVSTARPVISSPP